MRIFINILAFAFLSMFVAHPASASCDTEDAINALALNMYYEARGEGVDGMLLIADVTLTRVDYPYYPDNICDVVFQGVRDSNGNMVRHKCQFSWYCDGASDRPKDAELWSLAQELSEGVLDGSVETLGVVATHYYSPTRASRVPNWASVYVSVGEYAGHRFYYAEGGL